MGSVLGDDKSSIFRKTAPKASEASVNFFFLLQLTNSRQFSMVYTLLLKTGSLYNAIPGI